MNSAEVAAKLDRVRGWLAGSGYGAALFTTQPGVAWVTGGLEDRVVRNEEPALVWALVTETAAFLITTNIEQPRVAAEENLATFELHAVPWCSAGGLAEVAESLADGQKLTETPPSMRMAGRCPGCGTAIWFRWTHTRGHCRSRPIWPPVSLCSLRSATCGAGRCCTGCMFCRRLRGVITTSSRPGRRTS